MPGTPEGLPAVSDLINLGQEFFLWEMATAVAGAMLEINAFDQPNVQESKDYTKKYLETFTRTGTLPDFPPLLSEADVKVYARPERCRPQKDELLGSRAECVYGSSESGGLFRH